FIYAHDYRGKFLPVSETFADIGATIATNFNVSGTEYGKSLLGILE
ncbi:MAG TPA: phosphopentomutase, partial [Bacillota bacterium]|nr:phosphopentomutase [Bacillota bacterium]